MRSVLIAALLVCSAAIGWAAFTAHVPPVAERQITYRPIQVQDDGYVSSQACKACHPSQFETWRGSYHRTMTQVATAETVRADFDAVRVADVDGRPMRLERRGAEFWAEFDDPDSQGVDGQRPRITRQVVMITGSHHQQVYWYRTDRNRLVGQLPAMYLIAERRWIPRRAAFMRPPNEPRPSETGRWNGVCINCHATHGKPQLSMPLDSQPMDAQVADTTTAEFGIACEACHGPTGQHASINRNPFRRYWLHLTGQPDPTTVHPTRLQPRLASQVCGQCHGVWTAYDGAGERQVNVAGFPYRPGDELEETRFVAQPTTNMGSPTMRRLLAKFPSFVDDSFWPDGMIRVSGREYNGLIDSPCFKDARDQKRTLSCSSCHAMHKQPGDARSIPEWADTHQVSAGMAGNDACLQCHEPMRANITAHTKHSAGSTGSSCYNCHMPYTTYGLLKALRSHQVSSPTVTASVQTGRPNACNLCHLDKTLAWTSQSLERWYGTPGTALGRDEQNVAASLLWLLRGDAGQRALVAWSMGWRPAQQASGEWMAPYLAVLLDDPYDSVRFVASRSLRSLPGFSAFDYDFIAPSSQRLRDGARAMEIWRRAGGRRTDAALLFDGGGLLNVDEVSRLLRQRNDRPVHLRE
jgi:hypothetical protein